MGIKGLLPFVKSGMKSVDLREFSGQKVGIDTYCLLHRSVCADPTKYYFDQLTYQHVAYCEKYLELFRSYNIRPVFVFDGRPLPAKKETEEERKRAREQNRRNAAPYLAINDPSSARKYMIGAIEVSHKMAVDVIRMCRRRRVDTIVAPYEADAQLTYLCKHGFVDFVMTEDSDLIPFGCPKILYKLSLKGTGVLVTQDKLHIPFKLSADSFNIRFVQEVCVLAGCDYLKSLPGIGLAKAYAFRMRTRHIPIADAIITARDFHSISDRDDLLKYVKSVQTALAVIQCQYVFDPHHRKMVRLSLDFDPKDLPEAGDFYPDKIAFQAALGNIDPDTGISLYDLSLCGALKASIWTQLPPAFVQEFKVPDPPASTSHKHLASSSNTATKKLKTNRGTPSATVTSDQRSGYAHRSGLAHGPDPLRRKYDLPLARDPSVKSTLLLDEREIVDDGIIKETDAYAIWKFTTKSLANPRTTMVRNTYAAISY